MSVQSPAIDDLVVASPSVTSASVDPCARASVAFPEHAAISERLRYTAATRELRPHLPETTLALGVEDRTELAHAALADNLIRPGTNS